MSSEELEMAINKKAYELAKRVLETVDWKNCDGRRVLAVELKDGRRRER